jgi:hypothetical protein
MREVQRQRASTSRELAAHHTWSQPWVSYERQMRIIAVTETDAHLRLLAGRGRVASDGGTVATSTAPARCPPATVAPWRVRSRPRPGP